MEGQRRSNRSRKKVKYSKFSESSDEDFEENVSVTKKQKGEKRNKKKQGKKEIKNVSSDIPSRSLGSEKPALHKDLKVTVEPYQEDKKSKSVFNTESDCDASNKDDDQIALVQEQKENITKTKPSSRDVKQESKAQLESNEDAEYTGSSEEDENTDEDYKNENSDENDVSKTKFSRKPPMKVKKEKEPVVNPTKSFTRQAKKKDGSTIKK